ncbi:MAG: hypothetical protein GX102_13665 [Porphyromonadaceae bacterium]|nr:hypothetical protein [Porphyromonadaceae bacterium]
MILIYREINGVETGVCLVSDKGAMHKTAIMGIDEFQISVVVDDVLDVKEGDYIKHNGVNYTLNRDAEFTKVSDVQYNYELIFEHPIYTLLDKLFVHRVSGLSNFILTGKLLDFVELLVWCVNKTTDNPLGVDTGWTVGSVVDTEFRNIVFADLSCREVLNLLANEFNAEYYVNNKQINFADRIENTTGFTFEQGAGKGLYSITQRNVDKGDTVTRIYPRGGNKNVPNEYADGEGHLILPEKYLENFSEHSKVVEKKVTFEEEFPHFLGKVATVSGVDNVVLTCPQIDFDVEAVAVGDNARINFLTGDLMGVSFKFQWDYSLKKITLIKQDDEFALPDENGVKPQIPNASKKAKVNDSFNFTGLFMPESYVTASQARLRAKAQNYLEFYSRKRVKFDLSVDHRFMRDKQELKVGDLVTINIPQKNLSKLIRITTLDKNLYSGAISCTVSNYLDEKWEKKIENQISSLASSIGNDAYNAVEKLVDILQQYDSRTPSDRNIFSSLRTLFEIRNRAISKETNDVAAGLIQFIQGLEVGNYTSGVLGGGGAFKMQDGSSHAEVDFLKVRKRADFNEVLVKRAEHIGGELIVSAANMICNSVEEEADSYRCYFDKGDNEVVNLFKVDDQARCNIFYGSKQKYFWRLVTAIGDDWIELSKTDADTGSDIPSAGDHIFQLGNRTDTERQAARIISTVGHDAPSDKQYGGINSFSLEGKELTVFSSKGNKIHGSTTFTSGGQTIDEWVDLTEQNIQNTQTYEEYSVNGTSGWHYPYQSGDIYMRRKIGLNGVWGDAIRIVGQDGEPGYTPIKGTDYFDGEPGQDGTSQYVHIRYSNNADGTNFDENPLGKIYIGVGVTSTPSAPTSITNYKWSKIQGTDGLPGEDGEDGRTSYMHIKYSNDGGATFTANNGETVGEWIGIYTDFIQADSNNVADYTWNKVKGADGRAISNVDVEYAVNTSSTPPIQTSSLWKTDSSDYTGATNQRLWTRTKTTYSIGNPTYSTPANITPKIGATGKGITAVTEYYLLSESKLAGDITAPAGNTSSPPVGWSTTPPTWESGKYIWTCTRITYNNPTSYSWTVPVCSSEWEAVNDLEIGGVNLIRNGNFLNGMHDWGFGDITSSPSYAPIGTTNLPKDAISGAEITTTNLNGIWQNFADAENQIELNKEYTLSFYAMSVSGNNILTYGHEALGKAVALTSTWTLYKITFKPTQHSNFVFYIQDAGVFRITNIQLERGNKASAFKNGYLERAIQQDGLIRGGLTLATILGARDGGIVRSYMSGLTDNPTAIATGVENFGMPNETKNVDLRHDGSGYLANGNIKWNADGSLLEIVGKIIAQAGKIGGLNIFSHTLKSASMSFTEDPIETLSSLLTPITVSASTTQSNNVLNAHAHAYSGTLNLSLDSQVKFRTSATPDANAIDKGYEVYIQDSSGNRVFSQSGTGNLPQTMFTVNLPKGNFTIHVVTTGIFYIGQNYYNSATLLGEITSTIYANGYNFQTKIGNNGFYSFWDSTKYMHYSSSEGLRVKGDTDIPGGLGGGTVTNSGGVSRTWGKVTGCSRAGSTVTINHDIGDDKYTIQVAMNGSSTWYFQNRTNTSIQVVCAGTFDFTLVRTPY